MPSVMKQLGYAVATLGFIVGSSSTAYALPGDSVEAAIQRFSKNELMTNQQVQEQNLEGARLYTTSIQSGEATVTVQITSQPSFFQSLTEGVTTDDSGIYSAICRNLARKNYNLKQEPILQNLVQDVWGQRVKDDFVNARFTDRLDETAFGFYRALYKGNQFGYAAQCSMSPQAAKFGFTIYSLNDWEKIRKRSE